MIDDKKIEEAKEAFIADKKILGVMAMNDLACGFKEGAKWAINEFLKELLHPASKVPRNDNGKIVPIPLTTEILEKNGWRTQNRWYYYLDVAEGFISYIGIDFKHKSNKGHLYVEVDGNKMVEIQYCHELQHFLFVLGLKQEMKV